MMGQGFQVLLSPSSYLGNGLMAARLAALGALGAEGAEQHCMVLLRSCSTVNGWSAVFSLWQLWSGGFSKVPACPRNCGRSGASGVWPTKWAETLMVGRPVTHLQSHSALIDTAGVTGPHTGFNDGRKVVLKRKIKYFWAHFYSAYTDTSIRYWVPILGSSTLRMVPIVC